MVAYTSKTRPATSIAIVLMSWYYILMSYSVETSYSRAPNPADDYSATIRNYGEALMEEKAYRDKHAGLGSLDLYVAAKCSMVSGTIGETLQDEHEAAIADTQALQEMYPDSDSGSTLIFEPDAQPSNVLEFVAQAPVDLKAFGVAVGAFALVSAARRVRRAEQFWRDVQTDGFTPATVAERKRSRIGRRIGDADVTAVTTVAAYQAAKHGTETQDLVAAGVLNIAALGSVYGSKLKTRLAVAKFRPERSARLVR